MFVRKKYNKISNTISVHIQETVNGKSKFVKNIGKAKTEEELEKLIFEAKRYIAKQNTPKEQLSFIKDEDF